jgi:glycosyltransferase involved in cell wall biosynthesis
MRKKLRISFIIPFTYKTGGIAVVLEYYRQLANMGYEVNIFYPQLPYSVYLNSVPLREKISLLLQALRPKRAIPHFSEDIPVKPVVKISNVFIPDADVIIATAWPTAYDVAKLSPEKGRKFYFVQGYEIWHGRVDEVDNSYRLPLNIITIAPWLTDLMKSKFNRNDLTEIHSGIRLDKFYPPDTKIFDKPSILLLASDLELKGTRDAINALTIVKERYPRLEIKIFGMCARPTTTFDFEYHKDPPYEKLLSLYQDAAIFIFPSHKDGWGLTAIEAMACKCALVATCVGCIPIINNGENMILAEVKNPSSIAAGVIKLLEDTVLTENIALQGLKSVQGLDWSKSARMLLEHIRA